MIRNLNQLLELAKKQETKSLAIAAAEDKSVLNAVAKAKDIGLIKPIYIGNSDHIKTLATEIGITVNDNEIIHKDDSNIACLEAVKLVSQGKADLLMKGLVPTRILLKHVISNDYGLLSGKLLSHLSIFESPNYHKLLGLTDAAMNIAPSLSEKTSILKNSVEAFHSLGFKKPKVAVLAALENVNLKIPATTDAAELKKMGELHKFGNCIVDGPLALDNAISKEAAEHKGIVSEVAGDADILIAPDLNTGNVLYKAMIFLGNARCAAIIVGSKAPIVLTSRADSKETKFLSIALGVITAK